MIVNGWSICQLEKLLNLQKLDFVAVGIINLLKCVGI